MTLDQSKQTVLQPGFVGRTGRFVGGMVLVFTILSVNTVGASIPTTDPDFSIVLFPDTQYYNSTNAYVFQDQANWVATNQSALKIKMVVGLGDIVDGGGYPIDA